MRARLCPPWLAHAGWRLLALVALAPMTLAQPQSNAPSSAPSEAERLVFLHPHLGETRQPRTLRYRYEEETEGRARTSDRALLTLAPGAGGRCCDAHGDYLSGALAVNLPDIPDARGNPLLLYFLEGEVRRLQRTTGGQAAHFRRRIRQSLADAANVEDGTVTWRGQAVAAKTVRVAPFLTDPFRVRFAEQAATEYAFVFSDAVPGGVYRMGATVPATSAGAAPRTRRTLTLEEANP